MSFSLPTGSLARLCARRPWTTLALWLAVVAALGWLAAAGLSRVLTNEVDFTNRPESKIAAQLLEERFGRKAEELAEMVIVTSPSLTVESPAFRRFVEEVQGRIMALGPDVVQGAVTYYMTGEPALVSPDGRSTIVMVRLAGELDDAVAEAQRLRQGVHELDGADDFRVLVTGAASINSDFNEVAERDLRQGELAGIPVALAVLVVVFGSLVAAVLPLVLAVLAIVAALGLTTIVGQAFDLSFFVTNMITMMGLAVGIDYSLFVVSRYREERRRGRAPLEAIATAGATSSRAVLFSGLTVVLALAGLLIVPLSVYHSLAAGAILVVMAAVAACMTLLPAVLALLGDRIDRLRLPMPGRAGGQGRGFWAMATEVVMRHPLLSLLVAVGLLLAAAAFYFQMELGDSGVRSLPDDLESKQAFLLLQEKFPFALSAPALVVVDADPPSPRVVEALPRLREALGRDPAFGPPQLETAPTGDALLLSVPVLGEAVGDEAVDAVRRLRQRYIPQAFGPLKDRVFVGGPSAISVDYFDLTERYTPLVFAFVLGLSFVLLTLVFRSLVVPLKAIAMNLLSVGAAYGAVVLVLQKGYGAGLLGFTVVDKIEAWIPLFMFAVLFGLSMDYHVFLLSRIRERYDETGANAESVAYGLRTTASIITGAALIMVAVFGAFASGDLVMFQQVGFGLAVAIFLDATVIRSVLVPAGMKLLGHWNWYLPHFLRWLPDLRIEGRGARGPRPAPARE